MITLESFLNEVNAEFYDIEMDLCLIQGTPIYTEAANEAKKNIFQRVIEMIQQLIQKITNKVQEVIQNHKLKNAEELIAKNPELANKKVKVPDYDKLHKLNVDTLNRLSDEKCDPEKEMAKYKKQRNILLGSAAALTTVTIGLALSRNKLKKKADDSVQMLKETQYVLEKRKERHDRERQHSHDLSNELEATRRQLKAAKEESERLKTAKKESEDDLKEEIRFAKVKETERQREMNSMLNLIGRNVKFYKMNQDQHLDKINETSDKAIKYVREIQTISKNESNDIISFLSSIIDHVDTIRVGGRTGIELDEIIEDLDDAKYNIKK